MTDIEAAVDEAIAACGGDPRAAVRAVLFANSYLIAEVERLMDAVSYGFTRGRTSPARAAAMKLEEWRELSSSAQEEETGDKKETKNLSRSLSP